MGIKAGVYKKLNRLRAKDLQKFDKASARIEKHIISAEGTQGTKPKKMATEDIINLVVRFAFLLYGRSLFSYQLPFAKGIIRSMLENDGATLTALFARQSGKTEVVAQIVLAIALLLPVLANQPAFANDPRLNRYWKDDLGNMKYSGFKGGVMIGIYAPIEEQATLAFGRIKDCLTGDRAKEVLSDPDFGVTFGTFNGQIITMTGNGWTSKIGAYTASEGSAIEGKTYHLVILDEAQDVSDYKISKSISPFLAFNNGSMVQIGTPGLHVGAFYRNIQQNKTIHEETKIRNHFEYDYLTIQKLNPQYAKYVAQQIVKLGIASDEFRMNFKLEWLLDRGMFITENSLRLCGKDYNIDQVLNEENMKIAAIDWAKKIDSTIVTIAEVIKDNGDPLNRPTIRIIKWLEFHGVRYQEQVYEIINALKLYNVKAVYTDETGAGAMPSEMVETSMPSYCTVKKINFSKKQIMTDMWQKLSIEMLGDRVWYPNSKVAQETIEQRNFCQQMADLEKDTSKGYLTCHAPDIKGAHDDYCDSIALLVYGATELEDDIVDLNMEDEGAFATESIYRR